MPTNAGGANLWLERIRTLSHTSDSRCFAFCPVYKVLCQAFFQESRVTPIQSLTAFTPHRRKIIKMASGAIADAPEGCEADVELFGGVGHAHAADEMKAKK